MKHSVLSATWLKSCIAAAVALAITTQALGIDHEPLARSEQVDVHTVMQSALDAAPEKMLTASAADQALAYRTLGQRWIVGAPSLEASVINDSLLSDVGQRELEAGVQVQLWRPGERRDALQRGSAYDQRNQAWQSWYQLMIAGRVRESLAELEQADLVMASAMQAQQDASRLLDMTRQLQQAGSAAEMDVLQVESLLLAADKKVLDADAMVVDAEREYQILTGGLTTRPARAHQEQQSGAEEISSSHPQIQLLQADLNISEATILSAERQAKGSPAVQFGVRRERGAFAQPYVESVGVSVSIPLNSRRVVNASTSEARANRTAAEVALISQMRELTQQLHEIEHQLHTLAQTLPLSERDRDLSQRQMQMAETAFINGEVDMTYVVRAMQQARNADYEFNQLQQQQHHLISQYNQIIGVLP